MLMADVRVNVHNGCAVWFAVHDAYIYLESWKVGRPSHWDSACTIHWCGNKSPASGPANRLHYQTQTVFTQPWVIVSNLRLLYWHFLNIIWCLSVTDMHCKWIILHWDFYSRKHIRSHIETYTIHNKTIQVILVLFSPSLWWWEGNMHKVDNKSERENESRFL